MSKATEFIINGKKFEPGEQGQVQIHVARLPSGTVINLRVHVYRAIKPGPTMLVLAGVHGDEINGVETIRQAMVHRYFDDLVAGSVIIIPLLNIYGFINYSRDASEGKDVNRTFPGNMQGSLASRVAATLTRKILPLVDFGIDFHTGGGARYNYPQIRYSAGDEKAQALAESFATPYLIRKPNISKTLRKVGMGMGIPILIFEGGESLRLDGFSIEKGMQGLLRVMKSEGLIDREVLPSGKVLNFNKTSWIRAQRAGLFRWSQESGAKVTKGELLGTISDPYGESSISVLAHITGYIIGHNNAPVINQGDALFHIGFVE